MFALSDVQILTDFIFALTPVPVEYFALRYERGRRFPKRGGTSSVLVLNPAAECRLRCVGQFVLK